MIHATEICIFDKRNDSVIFSKECILSDWNVHDKYSIHSIGIPEVRGTYSLLQI